MSLLIVQHHQYYMYFSKIYFNIILISKRQGIQHKYTAHLKEINTIQTYNLFNKIHLPYSTHHINTFTLTTGL